MTRLITPSLAAIVEQLELEQTRLITRQHLKNLWDSEATLNTSLTELVRHLKTQGWIVPSGVRGVYEFVPGSRAGRYPSRDPLQPLRAALAHSNGLKVAVALGSALALLNIADRGPDRPEVAVARGSKPPRGLSQRMRVVHYDWRLPTTLIDGLPVHQAATILVHIAHRPTQVRSWGAVLEILPTLTEAVTPDALRTELKGRPKATSTRLAYLIARIAPNLLTAFVAQRSKGLVWFGPRRRSVRYDNEWNVADTILPMSPSAVATVVR
jgi:hypothetical protein